ncbi:MAG: hypothetical protein K2Y20_13935 [Sphingomonas sp.]|nr:hypothetical protein [Sphingomonas sp.]
MRTSIGVCFVQASWMEVSSNGVHFYREPPADSEHSGLIFFASHPAWVEYGEQIEPVTPPPSPRCGRCDADISNPSDAGPKDGICARCCEALKQ